MKQKQKNRRIVAVLSSLLLFTACAEPDPASQTAAAPLSSDALIGATPAVLNAAFGQPALRRVDGTSQVWLYHSSICGLNLILFPDSSGTPRVADAVPDNHDALSCTASLENGHAVAALEHPTSS